MTRLSHLLSIVPPPHMPMARKAAGTDRERYRMHKQNAKTRGIAFLLTFEEWIGWWQDTGHYHEYGRRRGQYVMARKLDLGAYELNNIECVQAQVNSALPHYGKGKSIASRSKPWIRDLLAAGWVDIGANKWRSPSGAVHPGPYTACQIMRAERRQKMAEEGHKSRLCAGEKR